MYSGKIYCNSLTEYSRLKTRVVSIGDLKMGGDYPIVLQSMTTTDTMDTIKTVEQSIRMINAGCELVRITAPSIKEAHNLQNIKDELHKRGYKTPLVADIHFTPNAAEVAARIVEKVRVNPGNYADKKKFEHIEYNDAAYDDELQRIRSRFIPLVKICKEYGTAMRIGTNHGSLSDRIMSRYGDTPLGMVESALEFLRICEDENYFNIVISMKASNPQVMVHAYRLLIAKLFEQQSNSVNGLSSPFGGRGAGLYPLHLGVTEAGEGEDGRIKSAVGIGTLLEDGIGDTVRVSLTEEPEFEIPVAKALVERYSKRKISDLNTIENNLQLTLPYSPFEYERRQTHEVMNIGGKNVPRVVMDFSNIEKITPKTFYPVGYNYSVPLDKWNLSDQACDFIYVGNNDVDFEIPGTLGLIYDYEKWKTLTDVERHYPLFKGEDIYEAESFSHGYNFVLVSEKEIIESEKFLSRLSVMTNAVFVLETTSPNGMSALRTMFIEMEKYSCDVPVIIKRTYQNIDAEHLQLYASTDCGALLLDGFGDGVWIESPAPKGENNGINPKIINSTSFGILQATRTRISKTEYISCPSCGRTLFDLQETTAKIRSRTEHLKGVKIGIMGCIVNGPGEMADADYGYVGVGVGKITLYKGKEVVKRAIDSDKAVDELIELIKAGGDWVDATIITTVE